ncbi:MAG: stage II sporulation protein M [Acidimicrobiales bacterium]|jgi:uncharacterized membrane protein SpoIIM required for sporulation
MNLDRFVAERGPTWAELEALTKGGAGQPGKLSPEDVLRLGRLYRFVVADLAVAQRSWPDAAGTIRLQGLVVRAHSMVYSKAQRADTAAEYLGRRLWQRIAELGGCLPLAAAILFGSIALGALWGAADPSSAAGLLPAGFHVSAHNKGGFYNVSIPGRAGLAVAIFVNNIKVAVLAIGGGFTGGLLTAYFLAYNGALVGVLGALEWRVGGLGGFLSLIVPHGLLELSCITIAGAAGFAIARALIDPRTDTRGEALGRAMPVVASATLSVMMFLVVAGLTEGIITPWDLPTPAAFGVGLALAGGFWAMVVWRGRPETIPAAAAPSGRPVRRGLSASA